MFLAIIHNNTSSSDYLLWIMARNNGLKLKRLKDGFNFIFFTSQDINWWTEVMWKLTLHYHSDGTHSLQSIHCWDTDAETHFSKSDEETNSS